MGLINSEMLNILRVSVRLISRDISDNLILIENDKGLGHETHGHPEYDENSGKFGNECEREFLNGCQRLKQANDCPDNQGRRQGRR